MKPPCKDCTKRYLGCHSECEEYADYKTVRAKQNEQLKKDRAVIDALSRGCSRRGSMPSAFRKGTK